MLKFPKLCNMSPIVLKNIHGKRKMKNLTLKTVNL